MFDISLAYPQQKTSLNSSSAIFAILPDLGNQSLVLHLLDVPATLNVSLLSTNLIENAIRNYRQQTRRVKRWHLKTDQVDRWSAVAFGWIEQGFRKIKGHQDLPLLVQALQRTTSNGVGSASPSGLRSTDSSPKDLTITQG